MMTTRLFLLVLVSLVLSSLHGRAAASNVPEFYIYDRSDAVGDRGSIVKAEAVANAVAGGKGYRVLYRTLSLNKNPAVASTLVFVPDDPFKSPLGTAVWVHRTTGIRPRCAPSILDDLPSGTAFSSIPGLSAILVAKNVVVAPDLLGLGATARDNMGGEVHPYLLAGPSADAVLDAVKASNGLSEHLQKEGAAPFVLSGDVVLFGHSEGAFAVLAALPAFEDLPADRWRLRGFAVSAPPAYVSALLPLQRTMIGQILTAYVVSSYSRHHPDLEAADLVTTKFLQVMEQVAELCSVLPDERDRQNEIFEGAGLGATTIDGETDGNHLKAVSLPPSWKERFDANVPRSLQASPSKLSIAALVTQGGYDTIVFPASARIAMYGICSYVKNNATITYYPFQGHESQFKEAKAEVERFVIGTLSSGGIEPLSNKLSDLTKKEEVQKARLAFGCLLMP